MPVYALTEDLAFPPPEFAGNDGLLAVGGDLSVRRLLLAYSAGIFPWYCEGQPILWWSPDPRLVLLPEELKVSRSLGKTIRRNVFEITLDEAFREVIASCARVHREEQGETWITGEMIDAYNELYRLGFAHSVESRREGRLVGGLYGVALGGVFFGESMFSTEADSSKVAFHALVREIRLRGIELIDCQVSTRHLKSLGAREIPRAEFLYRLQNALRRPITPGRWGPGGRVL